MGKAGCRCVVLREKRMLWLRKHAPGGYQYTLLRCFGSQISIEAFEEY